MSHKELLSNQLTLAPAGPAAPSVVNSEGGNRIQATSKAKRKIWIDLENSPHVPFFIPIIGALEARGFEVVLTARDCFQVCELADLAGLKYFKIGHHYGKNMIAKLFGLGIRVSQLAVVVMQQRPQICVSHGSRSAAVLAGLLGIPNITMTDYEHSDQRITNMFGSKRKKWLLTPAAVPRESFEKHGMAADHILHYPGIKEDVYVPLFNPDPTWTKAFNIQPEETLVTIRPPATEAHYHNPESDKLLMAVFDQLESLPEAKAILLPRTSKQEHELREARPNLFESGQLIVPKHALNGLDLIWRSDVVISGGGTMNREAAALGVPVYSFFRGTLGAVDKCLSDAGKLVLLESEADVKNRLKLVRRNRLETCSEKRSRTLDSIVNQIVAIAGRRG